MRYAIIADIHANLAAFRAVLEDINKKGGVDEFWCLGDTVDYGPDPRECLEILQRLHPVGVAGNHDLAAAGKMDTSQFSPDAAISARWTADNISLEEIEYLESLPLTLEREGFTLVHGSPFDPVWEYVVSTGIAERNFSFFRTGYCLVGHSHIAEAFKREESRTTAIALTPNIGLVLGAGRMIINPGAVGQPRDGNPDASYAIYDTEAKMLRLHRVPYDIEATQERILRAGLPVTLATRLKEGR